MPYDKKTTTTIYYSISETSRITGLGRTRLYQELNSGRLKAKKLGNRTVISGEAIDLFMAALPDYVRGK